MSKTCTPLKSAVLRTRVGCRRLPLLLFCCLLSAAPNQGQHCPPTGSRPVESAAEIVIDKTRITLPDIQVLDQDGHKVRFYSDLVKGRKLALGFFYTSCSYICTRHGELFAKLQKQLSSRLGKEVFLISVSMDPAHDTPARLLRWGKTYGRRPGWTLVTGRPEEMSKLLHAFTGNDAGPREAHSSTFYIANDDAGHWDYVTGYPQPSEIEQRIEGLTAPPVTKPDVKRTSSSPKER
jgi:protein SCO1/2